MSYNSQYTGQQAEELLQKASVIQTNGDAGKFLAEDGTYKEVNPGVQSYRVLTLNGTAPLKIGEKVQNLSYGYSAQSGELTPSDLNVNEVFVFHAPILNNEGEQRTLDCIGIKFSENELDVVSTTMIGTSSDNSINHYVVNIYYNISADQISYLIQDMNEIGKGGQAEYLDMSIFDLSDGTKETLSEENYQKVVNALENNICTASMDGVASMPMMISDDGNDYSVSIGVLDSSSQAFHLNTINIKINKESKQYSVYQRDFTLGTAGYANYFLCQTGEYKEVSTIRLISSDVVNSNGHYTAQIDFGRLSSETQYNILVRAKLSDNSYLNIPFMYIVSEGDTLFSETTVVDNNNDLYRCTLSVNSSDTSFEKNADLNIYPIQRVLTESEYSALGDTVNTDGVLYFVTPDSN